MQNLFKTAIVLWIGGIVLLGYWYLILWFQMLNHRIPNKELKPGSRQSVSLTDPADFTETGQLYRRRAMRVKATLAVWAIVVPIILGILHMA